MPLRSRRPLPSIRARLVALVLACAAPILAGYLAFVHDADRRERAHVAQDAGMIARALAAAVDRDLDATQAAARTLAIALDPDDAGLAAFEAGARRLLRPGFPVDAFALHARDGAVVLDTRRTGAATSSAPAAPSSPADAADLRALFAGGDAVTLGLRRGAARPWTPAIAVPVRRGDGVAYVLSAELRPQRLDALLADQHLPSGWKALVFDNQGRMAAHSSGIDRAPGDPMRPELVAALARAPAGHIDLVAPTRVAVHAAYVRTPAHGWTVVISFPRLAARDQLGARPWLALAGIGALLVLSLGLAWRIGGAIARSVGALTAPAAALGRGEPVSIPPLHVREAATVADALREVEGELQRYRAGLASLVAARTAELQRANAVLATVYATAPIGMAYLDRELRIVMVNDYLAAVNAMPASAHVGHTLPGLLGARGVLFEAPYRRVLDSGRPLIGVEDSGESPAEPGVLRHWLSSYYPVFGPDGDLAGINAVVLDITERKRQEVRDRDNEAMYRALFEGTGDAYVLVAHGAGFISANPAAARLFGYDRVEDFLALSPASSSPEFQPDGRRSDDAAHAYMARAVREGSCRFEWVHRRRDGSRFDADVLLTSVDVGGAGIVQGTVRDISARVATEAALRAAGEQLAQSERLIRAVTDHLPALVGYWDAGLRIRFANRPYLEWLGRSGDDAIGRTAGELLDARQMADVADRIAGVLAGRPQFFERRLTRAGARTIHAWASYIPDVGPDGRVQGFYMLHADVTALKRTQSRLQRALRAAQGASRAKSAFLAHMSHEIRTPMNAIIGLARLLEEAGLEQRERGHVARIGMAARSLLSMLNDVLDYSKVEAGRLALERTPFALDDVLAGIAALTAASAWDKGIEPVFAVAPGVPARLVGDPLRLEQVLLNLVGNAIKFTERGEVVLSVDVLGRDAQAGDARVHLAFAVRDTGIGIAPDQQARMFDAFSQADSSTSRRYGGTGLGLSISRRLVELMQGRLDVDSRPGAGATFRFDVWLGADAGTGATPPASVPAPAGRVLVADDNAASRAALAAALAGRGWRVDTAAGGVEALERLRADPGYRYALIDCAMPDLDGATVVARARSDADADADAHAHGPRVVLLAADPDRECLAALAAGLRVDAVLAKPFTPRALDEALADALADALAEPAGAAPAGETRTAPAPAARLAGLRLLVVEDNALNQEVARQVLGRAGARVDVAADGRAGVDMASEGGGRRYDAVLMDLQMPVMDGLDATRALRRRGIDVPVIAMTANATDDDRRRALAAGMDDYVAKPIDVDALVATVAACAGRRAAPPVAAPPAVTEPPAATPPAPHGLVLPGIDLPGIDVPGINVPSLDVPGIDVPGIDLPGIDVPGIDVPGALARLGGDRARLAALLQRFAATSADAPAALRALLDAGDTAQAARDAHRLRGVAGNLGAQAVADAAALFERAALDGHAAQAEAALDRLGAALDAVLDGVRSLPDAGGAARDDGGSAMGALEPAALRGALALLLDLLQNNNMAARTAFDALRAGLRPIAPAQAEAIGAAIAALRFGEAADRVKGLLTTMGDG